MDFKVITSVFVVLTLVLAGTTGYLIATPGGTTQTVTKFSTVSVGGQTGYTINIAYKAGIGFYLANASGFTLYFRSTDTPNSGKTTCTSSTCEKNWPAFYASALNLPPGLSALSFSTITPYNSTRITTYDGYALFYWIADRGPGDTKGQGIGMFYVATVPTPTAIAPITTTSTSTTSAATTTTTSTSKTCTGYYC